MLRNVARRLSEAIGLDDEENDAPERDEGQFQLDKDKDKDKDKDEDGSVDHGDSSDGEESTPSSASTPRPKPRRKSRSRSKSRPRAKSRNRRRSLSISRQPDSSAAAGKRVQWAPKNRIEHFEHVPLEEEAYDDMDERQLDEFEPDPAVLARLHRSLEPYATRSSGRPRSQSKGGEFKLPKYMTQPKPPPRSSNIKRLFRPSISSKGPPPAVSRVAEQPQGESSRQLSSASRNVRHRGKSAYDTGRTETSDSTLDPERQRHAQELHTQPVERYYDLGHSQLSSVPDIQRDTPESSQRVHDWAQRMQNVQGWAKKFQERGETEPVTEDIELEERGGQERGLWEKQAKERAKEPPKRNRWSISRKSFTAPLHKLQEPGQQVGGDETERRVRRTARTADLEAGPPEPLNEPLPLGSSHGVLGSILAYQNLGLDSSTSGLDDTEDESTMSEIECDRRRVRHRRDTRKAELDEKREEEIRKRRRSSVRARQPTGLSLPPPPAPSSSPSPEEETQEKELSSPEYEDKHKGKGVASGERPELEPSKRPVRDRRPTGPPPFYIPSSPEESSTPSTSPSPSEQQSPTDAALPAPAPREQSFRPRRQTGLPPLPPESPPPARSPSPTATEEEQAPHGKPPSLYTRIIKKSLSAPASVLHLPLPTHIPQPPIPGVVSSVPSRSSGGVVAALIATSQALAGPAAPSANVVAPDITQKGFTVSRYIFSSGQEIPIVGTTNEDQARVEQVRAGEALPSDEGVRYRTRRGTSETGTTDTTLAESSTGAPERLSKRPSYNWLPGALSRSASSIFRDRSSGYTSSQASYNGTDQESFRKRRRKKRRSKRQRIYIVKHISEIRHRQNFILKFVEAHLMFSGPSHRLPVHIQNTARVLDLQVQTVHFPSVVLISFGDESAGASMVKIIQKTGVLHLEKLSIMQDIYWKVIHDEMSVSEASANLEHLTSDSLRYSKWTMIFIGGLSSSAICTISFSGSFADSLVVFPLGCILVTVQIFSAKNELYSNVFEITVATLLSFLSAALASSRMFCYAALASSSVVLILPGFLVLSGSLELASKQIVSGAVRICFAVIYALFLGFGLSIGAEVFTRITHRQVVGPDDILCNTAHMSTDPWWQRKPSLWWAFLTVPLYSFVLTLRNHASLDRWETLVTILISCAGWTANHFAGVAFHNRPDLQSAIGAFAVGVIANLYGRFSNGKAYVVMVTGILFQLPSGLANGGLLTFAKNDNSSNNGAGFTSFESGFQVALQLIAVAIGLTVGLFISVVVVHPFGGSKKGSNVVFSL